jgi:hypothetical protein
VTVLLAMDFVSPPPWGAARDVALARLAERIAQDTPGLLWKVWIEDEPAGRAGGLYGFATREDAEAYREMHEARVTARGGTDIQARIWAINAALTAITRGDFALTAPSMS